MLIEIHMIQNHSPANLNRDDLGAPKTCIFGGVLRSRISSQCIKRSIRMSDEFRLLLGGIRTRRLPKYLADMIKEKDVLPLATSIMELCGLYHKEAKDDEEKKDNKKDIIIFLSTKAAEKLKNKLIEAPLKLSKEELKAFAAYFAKIIANERYAPDMALSGRMLEPASSANEYWRKLETTIEAALQTAHAISTHESRPEVDYFVAKDDIKGEDAGGAHIGESMYNSACFYKYFSIHWEQLKKNLSGLGEGYDKLAAHTVGAFIRGAALINPSGKQNSYAANNLPDGILIEIRNSAPISYANAFVKPAKASGERDLVEQSIAQLGQYVHDLDVGYGKPEYRFWFSHNLRYSLTYQYKVEYENNKGEKRSKINEEPVPAVNIKSLDELIPMVIKEIGCDWEEVKKAVVNQPE